MHRNAEEAGSAAVMEWRTRHAESENERARLQGVLSAVSICIYVYVCVYIGVMNVKMDFALFFVFGKHVYMNTCMHVYMYIYVHTSQEASSS